VTSTVLELSGVIKDYKGLRPLRIQYLRVAAGESTALVGFDQPMAEILVNLVTGATLPDRGDVKVFGRPTTAINDSAEWLALVDRFGIASERAVLLDGLSVIQNLAMPFTLEIEPPPADVRKKAERLATEVGLAESTWDRPVAELDSLGRVRIRLGRALALDPAVVILEHPTAALAREAVAGLGRSIRTIASARGSAALSLTVDRDFASAVATRVLTLEPATGRLKEQRLQWLRGVLR
jgi:ABC-type transporter Mla maintaining outer membrane lipid asymmetry ATPase subunit MlaF